MGAGNCNIWRHLRTAEVELEHMCAVILCPLEMLQVESGLPFADNVLDQIGKRTVKKFRCVDHWGNVVGVRQAKDGEFWYRVEYPRDGDTEDLELGELSEIITTRSPSIISKLTPKKEKELKREKEDKKA